MPKFRSRLMLICAAGCLTVCSARVSADDRIDLEAAYSAGDKARTAGDFPTAARSYERALAIAPRVYAANGNELAILLIDLAGAYRDSGQTAKAEPLLLRSLKIRESKSPDDPSVAESLDALGSLYLKTGRYTDAEQRYARSLKIRESKLPAGDLKIGNSVHGLAVAGYRLGKYPQAESYFQRVLKIREDKLGPNSPQLAGPLSDLAALYQAMGQLEKSDQLYQRAQKIDELKLGPNDLKIAVVLNNRAALLWQIKRYDEAEKLLQRSLKIREAKLGLNHPELTATINNLGNVYQALGQLPSAEKYFRRALQIDEAKLGRDHPETATHLGNLGSLLTMMGEYQKAEPLLLRSAKTREEQLGADHPDVGSSRIMLAQLDVLAKRPREAAIIFDRQRRSARRHAARVLPALSPAEQLAFLGNTDRGNLETALSLAIDSADDTAICELSAGWLANGKAVAQQTLAELTLLSRDPSLKKKVAELEAVRKQLATVTFSSYDPSQTASRLKQLAELTAQEQEISKRLQRAARRPELSDPWIEITAIRQALPADTLLVDIARIQPTNWSAKTREDAVKPAHYVAWIVPPVGDRSVLVVDLGPAVAIEAAVAEYQQAIVASQSGKSMKEFGEVEAAQQFQVPLRKLAALIWDPLRQHLDAAENLVVCPDAALWLIPWIALPIEQNQFAIEKWDIRYVTSGRELVVEKLAATNHSLSGPRIFANPNYDLSPREVQEALAAVLRIGPAPSPLPPDSGAVTAKNTAGSLASIGRVAALAGTAREAEAVAPKLEVYAKTPPKMYLDKQAQEGVFKLLRSPQVLLVSTHGFFLPEPQRKRDGGTPSQAGDRLPQGSAENPLVRCGLLLAGCNKRDSIPAGSKLDDGVLTGMEIVGTDLRGTELVVLSACETGIGKVSSGEGVAGLRQAFQLAGAQSVVATLWQIPDQATAQLMNDFFANLANGQSKSAALRNAQLTRIKARRDKFGAAHPLFWAAFTLTGK